MIEEVLFKHRLTCHPEVICDQTKSNAHRVFSDQNYRIWDLVRAHLSMIRGHFGLGMVWLEVFSGWYSSDHRPLSKRTIVYLVWEDSLIRGHLKRTIDCTMVWSWSGRCLENGLISGVFGLGRVWSDVISGAKSSGQ